MPAFIGAYVKDFKITELYTVMKKVSKHISDAFEKMIPVLINKTEMEKLEEKQRKVERLKTN